MHQCDERLDMILGGVLGIPRLERSPSRREGPTVSNQSLETQPQLGRLVLPRSPLPLYDHDHTRLRERWSFLNPLGSFNRQLAVEPMVTKEGNAEPHQDLSRQSNSSTHIPL